MINYELKCECGGGLVIVPPIRYLYECRMCKLRSIRVEIGGFEIVHAAAAAPVLPSTEGSDPRPFAGATAGSYQSGGPGDATSDDGSVV